MYVTTSSGPVQVGVPPDTIKDSMSLGLPVPTNFVLPTEFFDFNSGLTTAELEFPAYFNYFVLKKRVTIIKPKDVPRSTRDRHQTVRYGQ